MSKINGIHVPESPRNLAINGALDFWQEKEGTVNTVNTAATVNAYAADQTIYISVGSTVKNYSVQRSADVPTALDAGFAAQYSQLFTTITAIPSLAATDLVVPFKQRLEGLNYAQIHNKVTTFGFWIKTSVAGIHSFNLTNANDTRSYVSTVNVNLANTWEYKTVTVQMDNQGTWNFDESIGVHVRVAGIGGSSNTTAILNTWQTGTFYGASTAVNYMATVNSTVRVTMFSIVEGSLGLGAKGFQRSQSTIANELLACYRYFERAGTPQGGASNTTLFGAGLFSSTTAGNMSFLFSRKRAQPSVSIVNQASFRASNASNNHAIATMTPSSPNVTSVSLSFTGTGFNTGNIPMLLDTITNGAILIDARL